MPSNNHLTLSWSPPDNSTNGLTVTGYNVYLESNFVALLSSSVTTFEYTVTNGQVKTLSVESVNSAISSVENTTVTGVTSAAASITGVSHADPAVPVLTANEVQGETKVELSWSIDDTYLNYLTVIKVYREILDVNGVVLQANSLINTLYDSNAYSDIDNGENQSDHFAYGNTMTYYVVITYTDVANSFIDGTYTYSDVTSASKSVVIYDNPSSPTGLTVMPSNNHLTLSWTPPDNSTNGLTVAGYNVYLDSVSVALLSSSTTNYTYSVTNGQVKTLSVESVNSAISSVTDVTVTGITSAATSITGVSHADPAVPVLTANEVQGETKVELSWSIDDTYVNYVTVIKLYREILNANGVVLQPNVLIKTLFDSNAYSDVDNGENQSDHFAYGNTMNYYVVITYTDVANSYVDGAYTYADVTSASKSVVIYDIPSSPTGLTVVPSDGRLTLSWSAANNTGKGLTVTGYNLYLDSSFVAVVSDSITSYSYNLTNGQQYLLGVQAVTSAISSVEDVTVAGLLSSVQNANGKPYKLATSTIIANATNANNGVQAGKTVLLTFTIDNSESTCSSVEIYRKISSPSNATLENFTLIDTITSNLVNGENRYIDRDTVQHSVNFLNGNTMKYHVKLNYSDNVNVYSYQVISNDDYTVPYDRPTPTNYIGQPVSNKAVIIPLDLNNGEFTQFNLVFSKNGSDITTIVAVGLTNGGNGTVLQYSSSSSVVIGNVSVNNQNNSQIDGVCAANQVKVVTCSFPSPVTDVTDVLAFINNQAGSLLTSYPMDGIFLP
jgi:ribosomal protein L7/L12